MHPFSLCSQDYQSRENCSPVNLLYSCKSNSQYLVEFHEKLTRVDKNKGFRVEFAKKYTVLKPNSKFH